MKGDWITGEWEPATGILHFWCEKPTILADEASVTAFFDEVQYEWIKPLPKKPFLLVDYTNLHIRPSVSNFYAKSIQRFQPLILGTARFNVKPDLTGVAVSLGNAKLDAQPNIYPDEQTARDAIAKMQRK
jgi:hypothetical protein